MDNKKPARGTGSARQSPARLEHPTSLAGRDLAGVRGCQWVFASSRRRYADPPSSSRVVSWHCAIALDGASEGRPARMQSCGARRAATIGVIQMSAMESRAGHRRKGECDRPSCAKSGRLSLWFVFGWAGARKAVSGSGEFCLAEGGVGRVLEAERRWVSLTERQPPGSGSPL